jgi:hypothetical protein
LKANQRHESGIRELQTIRKNQTIREHEDREFSGQGHESDIGTRTPAAGRRR